MKNKFNNNSKNKKNRRTLKNKNGKKGGKVLASGGFGCVFTPALRCEKTKTRKRNGVSKLMTNKHAIKEYNEIVQRLSNIIQDVTNYSKSGMLFSTINTKNKYPPISQNFDEKTIYLSFIYFCKFKSLIPISDDLLPLCTDKPDLSLVSGNLSLDKIIQNLMYI
jgi:hypothetical protein